MQFIILDEQDIDFLMIIYTVAEYFVPFNITFSYFMYYYKHPRAISQQVSHMLSCKLGMVSLTSLKLF